MNTATGNSAPIEAAAAANAPALSTPPPGKAAADEARLDRPFRLTAAERDGLEEAVERTLEQVTAAHRAEADRGARPSDPVAGWLPRAMIAVVRSWRAAGERARLIEARREEVRRELLLSDPRLW